ncbi:MAG: T9SS-dependent M36 family metallopeptidase [Bacteroidia bacterium]|nr:T9SS-dependent M36 family metallopeptidase [Bacteroidia bacterium]
MVRKFTSTLLLLVLGSLGIHLPAQNTAELLNQQLKSAQQELGLTNSDLEQVIIQSESQTPESPLTHIYFRQQAHGIGIYQAVGNASFRENGQLFGFNCAFIPGASERTNLNFPQITAKEALEFAVQALDLGTISDLMVTQAPSGADQALVFNKGGISQEPIPARLMYFADKNSDLRLAWDLSILPLHGQNWWSLKIDAADGKLLEAFDWNLSCNWGLDAPGEVFPWEIESPPLPLSLAVADALPPLPSAKILAPDSYTVFSLPVESPNFGGRSLVVNPAVANASPFGWHDTNGAPGAEFTITRGNNVHAQEDQNGNDGTGASPNGTASLDFNFAYNPAAQPNTYTNAATTNLFYMNNRMHDVWYQYGFTESAGNFQSNNYGRGGTANDYVLADAQDGSGMNNANFGTPTDGNRPRMQMFLWNGATTVNFIVNSPPSVAGSYGAVEAGFGPGLTTTPITANLVLVNDGTGSPSEGCSALVNGAAVNGRIALVDRGTCTFVTKVSNAQAAGAIACVVCNNVPGSPIAMGGAAGGITIPSVMISQSDCALLKAQLASGVNVSLSNTGATVDKDGDLDNGIIAHEYGHGISNRLTGGPANSNCLGNAEQMGEGWSDFFGLVMTIESGDLPTDIRGIGTYAISEPPNGGGIRPAPYTTDMTVNPFTYGDISNTGAISQPHGIGFLWCNMLWEMTWNLIGQYGFDPDIVNGTGGNNMAMRLVIEGIKLQPCSPGFVNGRDAILAADNAIYGGANQCLIWAAFAKRGLGFSASQGSANNRSDGAEAFDIPVTCQNLPVVWQNIAAVPQGDQILVKWDLAAEFENQGFEVLRRSEFEQNFQQIGFVKARGNSAEPVAYDFPDTQVEQEITYFYRLRQLDLNGFETFSTVVAARLEGTGPQFSLYPNPAQGTVTLGLAMKEEQPVEIRIFNILGMEVFAQHLPSARPGQQVMLDLSILGAGAYLVKVGYVNGVQTKKLILERD